MIRSRVKLAKLLLAPITLFLVACDYQEQNRYEPSYGTESPDGIREYIFGVHPQRNPEKLHAIFGQVVDYLNAGLPQVRFVFEASRHYQSYDEKIAARHFNFLLPNPYETLLGIDQGYTVFAKMRRDEDLRGLIVVRRDSGIRKVADLKGKAVSFPAPTALAATMLPMYFLHQHGLDVAHDIEARYVGSMESSLLNIERGNVAAGTVYPPAWRMFKAERPQLASELKVIWETEFLPNNSVMARDDVPQTLVAQVKALLLDMHQDPEGQRILNDMDSQGFESADNEAYSPVRDFMQRYQKAFGQQ